MIKDGVIICLPLRGMVVCKLHTLRVPADFEQEQMSLKLISLCDDLT